jgi:hypothetical protein
VSSRVSVPPICPAPMIPISICFSSQFFAFGPER